MPKPRTLDATTVAIALASALSIAGANAQSVFYPKIPQAAASERYRLGAGVVLDYDSNLLRLPSRLSPADVGAGERSRGSLLTRALVEGAVSVPFSRQEFTARTQVARHWYLNYGYLDHVAANVDANLRWQAGNLLGGNVGYVYDRSLAGLVDFRASERNMRTTRTAFANGELVVHPRWRLYAGARHLTASVSAAALRPSDLRQTTGELGITYRASDPNFVRVLVGATRGEYPNRDAGGIFDNRFDQRDLAVEMRLALSSLSALSGRVGYTDRRHPIVAARDFRGPTGDLRLDWGWSGKSGLVAGLRREIGLYEDVDASYAVSDVLSLAPWWEIAAQVRLEFAYEHWVRRYPGDPQFVASALPQRRDTLDYARIGLRWTPLRALSMRAGYQWSTRESNRADLDFRDNLFFVSSEVGF